MKSERTLARKPLLAWISSLLLTAYLTWPLLHAQLTIDDWVFLSTARLQAVDPMAAFTAFSTSHFYEPLYFRPTGIFLWLTSVAWLGSGFITQLLINLLLHAANVGLLVASLRRLGLPTRALGVVVVLSLLGPVSLTAASWPSNRFDLLATFWSLLVIFFSLKVAEQASPRRSIGLALAVLLAAVLAAFSKEWAYVVLSAWAVVLFFGAPWHPAFGPGRTRWLALGLLTVLMLAFAWRHSLLSHAYAAVPKLDAATVLRSMLGWAEGYLRWQQVYGTAPFLILGMGIVFLIALIGALIYRSRLAGVLILLLAATILPQLAMAGPFAAMLNGEPLATLTYARFFYAPWLAMSALIALGVAGIPGFRARLLALMLIMLILGSVWPLRVLSESYAAWSSGPVHSMARAAADLLDQEVGTDIEKTCLLVLLDTHAQDESRWFARFADAAAKSYSQRIEQSAHCYVMTEMTPYIFIQMRGRQQESPKALKPIINPDGTTKKDEGWARVRYRYRLPPQDLFSLHEAKFFRWDGQGFREVTAELRASTPELPSRSWGF